MESRLLSGIRQLTFEGRRSGEGYFSPDGRRLIFQSERDSGNPFYQIFIMDLETGDLRRVSSGVGKTTCSWFHPTADRVLFASTHEDPEALKKQRAELDFRASGQQRRYAWDYDPAFEIYSSKPDGSGAVRLTDAQGYDAEGNWSPDGAKIVFASNRHAFTQDLTGEARQAFEVDPSVQVDIYWMDADGSNLGRLTDAEGYDGGPFFSPDGKSICWRRFSPDGATAEIYLMDADGENQRAITDMGLMSWAPYFHPSGEYLIFTTNKHGFGNFELFIVDTQGRRSPVRVTYRDGFDGLPAFSPDGGRLSWTSNRSSDRQSQVYLAQWNHEAARELLGLGSRSLAWPETSPEVLASDLQQHLEFLASDALQGRLTGSQGERRATEYIAGAFQSLGLQPAGDDGSYFQDFEFTAGVSLGSSNQLRAERGFGGQDWQLDRDWRPLSFSETGEFEAAGIVFAGYGISAPSSSEGEEYDSYTHLDVAGKWVLVFRYLPEQADEALRRRLNRYSDLRFKATVARDQGARGMLIVSGPSAKVREQLVKLSLDTSLAGSGLPVLSISDQVAEALLRDVGKSLAGLQAALDSGQPQMGFPIPDVRVSATIDLRREKRIGRNVLARLSGEGSDRNGTVVFGAHLDHLGRGESSSSRAREEESGLIHYGADDNASGVSGLLEVAEYLAGEKAAGRLPQKRDILFAGWSGEELGLLGSSHFARTYAGDSSSKDLKPLLSACLNMDMIGRLRDNLVLQGTGSSSVWNSLIEQRNAPVGLPIVLQKDSYLPTDATSFYLRQVPVLSAFTGSHDEYHTPRDTPDTINYQGAAEVSRFMALIARDLVLRDEPPEFVAMPLPTETTPKSGLRIYLGTIPDYAGDVVGVMLSGVSQGGPADQAGMRAGDVIVELAGRKIVNIYDYTYAIDTLRIGETVSVVVHREGQEVTLRITPSSRE